MTNWMFFGFVFVLLAIGTFLYLKKQNETSDDQLNQNKMYIFNYLCVFETEDKAKALASFIQPENVSIEVIQSPNKTKWWAKFSLLDTPKTNYYIELETKLIDGAEKFGGKYGYIDIIDPDEQGVVIE